MNQILKRFAAYLSEKRRNRRWKKVAGILSGVVVFSTIYALILPAITMDQVEPGVVMEQTLSKESGKALEPSAPAEPDDSSDEVKSIESPNKSGKQDPEVQETYVQGRQTVSGDDYAVTAAWGKDAGFPDGVQMRVAELRQDSAEYQEYLSQTQQKIKEKTGLAELMYIRLFDISFGIKEADSWREIEPEAQVNVQITYSSWGKDNDEKDASETEAAEERTQVSVVHFAESGAELVKAETEQSGKQATVVFDTAGFSIYAIAAASNPPARLTYKFENADGTPYIFRDNHGGRNDNQIIKDGEVLYEVGIPIIKPGQTFRGWYIYDKATNKYGDEIHFNTKIPVEKARDGMTVYVRPYFGEVVFFTFYADSAGTIILDNEQVSKQNGQASFDISQEKAPEPNADLRFMGWSETKGTDNDTREVITNTNVTSGVNKAFYPVFRAAHWLSFTTGPVGSGVEFISPILIEVNKTTLDNKPKDPTWRGYTFEGWSETEDPDPLTSTPFTKFDFNKQITKDVHLYAQWKPDLAVYTVMYWKQVVTDSKDTADANKSYEYFEQDHSRKAQTGTTVSASAADRSANKYPGFTYNATRSHADVVVKADGSSIINLYYDRNLMTMNFSGRTFGLVNGRYVPVTQQWQWPGGWVWVYSENGINQTYTGPRVNSFSFTGLYGQSLVQNNYDWPAGTWVYNNGTGMTFLGQFIFPPDSLGNTINFTSADNQGVTLGFYLQNEDGTWPIYPNNRGARRNRESATFTFTNKYEGFELDSYRIGNSGNWIGVRENETRVLYYNQTLNVRYRRTSHNLRYRSSGSGDLLPGYSQQVVLYGAPIKRYYPDKAPLSQIPGKRFNGRWYADAEATTQVFFKDPGVNTLTEDEKKLLRYNITASGDKEYREDGTKEDEYTIFSNMPNADISLYAGWEDIWYWVKIDPGYGELSGTEATYFWEKHGALVSEYKDIKRHYVEDANGIFYYHYDEFNTEDPNGHQPSTQINGKSRRAAFYTTDQSLLNNIDDKSKRYRYDEDAYHLIGWYEVKIGQDGKETLVPYNFAAPITHNLILRAVWRRVGEYQVVYENRAYDTNGNLLTDKKTGEPVSTANPPNDSNRYDDQSDAEMQHRPDTIPDGYVFRGWWYNGAARYPEESFVIDAKNADTNKKIHLYPVLKSIDDITLETTEIIYNGNGGTTEKASDPTAHVTVDDDKETVTIDALQVNKDLTLPGGDYFKREGYTLVGWSNQGGDNNPKIFALGEAVAVDRLKADLRIPSYTDEKGANQLFAVWEKNKYTVTVEKKVVGLNKDQDQIFTFFMDFSPILDAATQANFGLAGRPNAAENVQNKRTYKDVPYETGLKVKEESTDNYQATITIRQLTDAGGNLLKPAKVTTVKMDQTREYDVGKIQGDLEIIITNTRVKQPVKFVKVATEDTTKFLKGAVFDLYDSDGRTMLYTNVTSGDDGILKLADGTEVFNLEASVDGKVYYLKETRPPDGYNLAEKRFTLTVYSTKAATSGLEGDTVTQNTVTPTEEDGVVTYIVTITNSSGIALPETGGSGTLYYTLSGLFLIATALLYLIYRTRSGERRLRR